MPKNDESFKEFALEQLADLPDVDVRYMFGGWGFYLGGRIFGLIADGAFFLKADDAIKADLGKLGSAGPFEYAPGKLMNGYWEAPLAIVENRREFERWARRSALLSEPKAAKKPKAMKGAAGKAVATPKRTAKKSASKPPDQKPPKKAVAKKATPAKKQATTEKPVAKLAAKTPAAKPRKEAAKRGTRKA